MKKVLTAEGVKRFKELLKANAKPEEAAYRIELKVGNNYTYQVPNYSKSYSQLDIYINGLRLAPSVEYTVSDAGIVNIINYIHDTGNYLLIIHRKY